MVKNFKTNSVTPLPNVSGEEHGKTAWDIVGRLSMVSDASPTLEINSKGPLWDLHLLEAAIVPNHFLDA